MPGTDLLLDYMNEHYEQARQHENLRSQAAGLFLVAIAALVGFGDRHEFKTTDISIFFAIIVIAHYGYRLVRSHYIMNRFHVKVAQNIRKECAGGDVALLQKIKKCRSDVEESFFVDNKFCKNSLRLSWKATFYPLALTTKGDKINGDKEKFVRPDISFQWEFLFRIIQLMALIAVLLSMLHSFGILGVNKI